MGKSTFLNRVLGQKIAIVSHKPQTTRTRILGVLHRPGAQLVFLDTPGIHKTGKNRLNKAMVGAAFEACREVDAAVYFVDAQQGITPGDVEILQKLPLGGAPLYLAVNKADLLADKAALLPILDAASKCGVTFSEIAPISALEGDNVTRLVDLLADAMPEGPQYFPDDQVTDQPERFIAGEIVREKLFTHLKQELPYSVGVEVESFKEEGRVLHFHAAIVTARDTQKRIIIGAGGAMIKKIGTAARFELEKLLGCQVMLKLFVKVKKDWFDNPRLLREMGYPDELSDLGGGSDDAAS
ncbi:putative GTP-binding protein Era [Magnetofaba australis IT-1]|uniref:GTPase Era n=2 Tax=Magnetofaba TaxID=1472292 RepID=A0A1Y2K501_9PROT|nr:putative GTP-binding protein Era [Magnetofaba australis IT-1]